MAQSKPDMTAVFKRAADTRKAAQIATESAILTGKSDNVVLLGRRPKYTKTDPKTTMTINITTSRKEKLRLYAFQHRTTASDLIGEMIDSLDVDQVLYILLFDIDMYAYGFSFKDAVLELMLLL